jgi:endonuclease YncB( thermonuclease family)
MNNLLFLMMMTTLAALPTPVRAHGGGLDKHGCHNDRKKNDYHCHGGDQAKKSFRSRQVTIPPQESPLQSEVLSGEVVGITDGDTLLVLDAGEKQHTIRLVDIDAPERKQAFGTRSRQALAALCFNKPATVIGRELDQYGRILGRVLCAGVDANAKQVTEGMAWVFVRYAPKNSPLYRLEQQARRARRGLWADANPIAPWDYRARKWQERQRTEAR